MRNSCTPLAKDDGTDTGLDFIGFPAQMVVDREETTSNSLAKDLYFILLLHELSIVLGRYPWPY